MGLASALSTALTGLAAAETMIDVSGNNLANSSTVGFKASEATFATQFLQTQSLGSGPTTTGGGTNPRQIGLGTMVADITPDFTQGTIEISSNPTDLAIQGNGFYIVEGRSGDLAYTRNGIFKMNSNSQLTTVTGNRLLGYGVNDQYEIVTTRLQPVTIPLGSAAVAKATGNVFIEGTLSPTGDLANAAKIIQSNILGDGNYTFPEDLPTTEISGAVDFSGVSKTAVGGGAMVTGTYYYRFIFADGDPGGSLNLEGTPSVASTAVAVDNGAGTNAVDLSGFAALVPSAGNYTQINIYRTDGSSPSTGTYTFIDSINVGDATYNDTSAAGTTALDEGALTGQYYYYVAYGKAGSDPSRPSDKIGPLNATNGRIHFTDLDVPVDNPNGWDSWIIYRNAPSTAGSDQYFELTTIPFTTTTPYFTDDTPDSTLYLDADHHTTEIDLDGPKIQRGTLLSNVYQRDSSTYGQVFSITGLLNFTGQKGGSDVSITPKQMLVTPTSTVGDLLDFMAETWGIQPSNSTTGIPPSIDKQNPTGTPISPGGDVVDGRIRFTGNNGVYNAIDISELKWAAGSPTISLPFTTYQNATGESAVTNFVAYDSLGISCNVRLTAVKESFDATSKTTSYRWFADSYDNELASGAPNIAVGTGLIKFDSKGNVSDVTQSTVTIYRDQVASNSPLRFDLNFSALSGLAASSSTLSMKSQDGSAPGVLTSFIVGEDGLISGVFSNGVTRDLGQIRLVRFSNPSGLEQLGENLYATGVNSGMPVQGNPGENGIGTIVAGAVELSNADVGSNLIDLILASTMYRGNTKVITTVQQMLDTLLQLQR